MPIYENGTLLGGDGGGGGGGSSEIPAIGGHDSTLYLSASRYFTLGSDPFAGQTRLTLAWFGSPAFGLEDYDQRHHIGTRNRAGGTGLGGGASIFHPSFDAISPSASVIVTDGVTPAEAVRNWTDNYARLLLGKWQFMVLTVDAVTTPGTVSISLYINMRPVGGASAAGTQIAAGGNYSIGISGGGGATGVDGTQEGLVNGGGYILGAIPSRADIAAWTQAVFDAKQFVDLPQGPSLTLGHRVPIGGPGDTWAPFVGAGNLTRVGTAPGYGARLPALG